MKEVNPQWIHSKYMDNIFLIPLEEREIVK